MGEFSHEEEFQPFLGLAFTEDMEVCLEFLIIVFHFSVSLWVVSQGESYVILRSLASSLVKVEVNWSL